jgi:hypothetical protein
MDHSCKGVSRLDGADFGETTHRKSERVSTVASGPKVGGRRD